MRPVDIEADVHEMERRKRVEAIMNSKVRLDGVKEIDYNVSIFQLFREELERVVGDSLRESGTESLAGLMSDVMNIKSGSKYKAFHVIYKKHEEMKIFLNPKINRNH